MSHSLIYWVLHLKCKFKSIFSYFNSGSGVVDVSMQSLYDEGNNTRGAYFG